MHGDLLNRNWKKLFRIGSHVIGTTCNYCFKILIFLLFDFEVLKMKFCEFSYFVVFVFILYSINKPKAPSQSHIKRSTKWQIQMYHKLKFFKWPQKRNTPF